MLLRRFLLKVIIKLQRCLLLYLRAVEKVINLCCLYLNGLNSIEITPSVFKAIVYGGKEEEREVFCSWEP